jgi:signal transduction histidine kinase
VESRAQQSEPDVETCRHQAPDEASSQDPEVLRQALIRESFERKRAECLAHMQADIVQLALDLLVREPDIEGFFGALTKTMVEEGESRVSAVWLLNEERQRCEPWMAYVEDRLFTRTNDCDTGTFPRECLAEHIYAHTPGWTQTIEYEGDDARLPEAIRAHNLRTGVATLVVAPLLIGGRTLGWLTASSQPTTELEGRWWRVVLIEAIARQAALALQHSRLIEANRAEERRKAILEERNRLARDIHDNLAQGFAAILMQLQAVRRSPAAMSPEAVASIETVIDVARAHLTEARRSVGTLRPNVGNGEDIATALKRLADMRQRTDGVPIDLELDELPRFGDGVEREIIAIAQEALTNAVRHSRARRITIRASTAQSVGLRLSVADDGRGIARERTSSGFGMTSMQERADRIGASLTIVTAPRNGTEVVLAWEPSSLPTQVHVAN